MLGRNEMKIKCKCGRTMVLDAVQHAGKKVACGGCRQRYRLPPLEPSDPTIQMKPWKDEGPNAPPAEPKDVGAVPLGEKLAIGWVFISLFIMLILGVGGAVGAKLGIQKITSSDWDQYGTYMWLGLMWAPSLAFVLAGWVTGRFSPGRTIAEPAIGAVLFVAIVAAIVVWRPGPLDSFLGPVRLDFQEAKQLKVNLIFFGMFNGAMLACAGGYFGEVAQERSTARG